MSPKFLEISGYVFKTYSREESRMHVHVLKDGKEAKYWLEPEIELADNEKFKSHELSKIVKIIKEYEQDFKKQWRQYFG